MFSLIFKKNNYIVNYHKMEQMKTIQDKGIYKRRNIARKNKKNSYQFKSCHNPG